VLPAERRQVGQQGVRDHLAAAAHRVEGTAEIDGVSQGDGGRDQGEATGPVLLRLGGSVAQAPEPVEADGAGERIAGLALVQRHGGLPPESRLLQPVQGVEGAFDAADLAQRHGQAVLPRVAAEALQHQRRADHASADQHDGAPHPS